MIVRFTATGRRQFLDALSYIHQDRPEAARAFRDRTKASLSRLAAFPEVGRALPEFPDLPFRELVLPPCRFFYRIKDDTVWIVAVWHGAQLPDQPEGPGGP